MQLPTPEEDCDDASAACCSTSSPALQTCWVKPVLNRNRRCSLVPLGAAGRGERGGSGEAVAGMAAAKKRATKEDPEREKAYNAYMAEMKAHFQEVGLNGSVADVSFSVFNACRCHAFYHVPLTPAKLLTLISSVLPCRVTANLPSNNFRGLANAGGCFSTC